MRWRSRSLLGAPLPFTTTVRSVAVSAHYRFRMGTCKAVLGTVGTCGLITVRVGAHGVPICISLITPGRPYPPQFPYPPVLPVRQMTRYQQRHQRCRGAGRAQLNMSWQSPNILTRAVMSFTTTVQLAEVPVRKPSPRGVCKMG